jgi:hypothetical protein
VAYAHREIGTGINVATWREFSELLEAIVRVRELMLMKMQQRI